MSVQMGNAASPKKFVLLIALELHGCLIAELVHASAIVCVFSYP
jgi:hypothetical protein